MKRIRCEGKNKGEENKLIKRDKSTLRRISIPSIREDYKRDETSENVVFDFLSSDLILMLNGTG